MKKYIITLLLLTVSLFAGEQTINSGDTAWMLISTALVMFMTPVGLAMFYAGMTRTKNVVNTFFMVFSAFAVSFIMWIIIGYSIAFGPDVGAISGGFKNALLSGISWKDLANPDLGQLYPKYLFVVFQGTFAAITVAIIAGSVSERIKLSTWIIFSALRTIVVYAPIVHMVWGGGYLFNLGTLDFAGGTVVHMNGGLAGLILAILIGKRIGYEHEKMRPATIIMTAIGAGVLWFGWYGFNGGSAFGANQIAGLAFLTTTVAVAASIITWCIIEYSLYKKITLLGGSSGAIAGLVAITPAAGFVDTTGALIIGAVGSLIAYFGVTYIKNKFKYDDSLDAFGIHFLSGLWGAIATGIFALNDKSLLWDGPLKESGDRLGQIIVQLESVLIVGGFTLIGTLLVYMIATIITNGGRVHEEHELKGLDVSLHGEKGFHL